MTVIKSHVVCGINPTMPYYLSLPHNTYNVILWGHCFWLFHLHCSYWALEVVRSHWRFVIAFVYGNELSCEIHESGISLNNSEHVTLGIESGVSNIFSLT